MKIFIIGSISFVFISMLSACGLFGDRLDPVAQGSLTLTPLTYPDGMQAPSEDSGALRIPETVNPEHMALVESDEAPPPLDLDKANREALALQSKETKEEKQARLSIPSELKQTPQGHQYLLVGKSFDILWETIGNAATKLGFKVEDRDRGKQYYLIYRDIIKSAAELQEEKETGIERRLGNREAYQIYLDKQDAQHTAINIRNSSGQNDDSGLAQHLLVQIKAYLEQPIK